MFNHLYLLSNNNQTKFADWVVYEVDITIFGVSPVRDWSTAPLIHPSKTLEKDYYKGASSSALQADRGNQAPLATFASSKYWYELNYLSNITPQDEDLNQGPWKSLEDAEGAAVGFRNSLFVITGPLYLKEMPPMKPIRFRQLTSKLFITKMATAYFISWSNRPSAMIFTVPAQFRLRR